MRRYQISIRESTGVECLMMRSVKCGAMPCWGLFSYLAEAFKICYALRQFQHGISVMSNECCNLSSPSLLRLSSTILLFSHTFYLQSSIPITIFIFQNFLEFNSSKKGYAGTNQSSRNRRRDRFQVSDE